MDRISLEGLEFFAYHGYYDEEQKIGNKYAVDLIVYANLDEAASEDKLAKTVNYETLYSVVLGEIQKSARLLEHIAQRIVDATFDQIPEVEKIEVSVSKFNPPVGGMCNRAKVTLIRDRN
ncbi:MAG: dihydroneopterin aldolase [Bacteroidota bacterium]